MSVSPNRIPGRPGVLRFGLFEADLETRELRKQGRKVKLQDQPFALLAILLDRAGSMVSREELRAQLWPADTFVDFDHSLNTAVNKLREVLGDSASSPRFIETLARRGYRFVAEVERSSPESGNDRKPAFEPSVSELPRAHRGATRFLFGLIQFMYLVFYVEALIHWQGVERVVWLQPHASAGLTVALVAAAVGIPVRFYLLSGVAFDYSRLGEKFQKIFTALFVLDELWAIAPFLLLDRIGLGPALAATAALIYVPFAERTLVRMAYEIRA